MRIWTTVIGQRLDGAENTRSMILCDHLMRRGHEVTLWTSAYDHIRKHWRDEWLAADKGPMRRRDGLNIRFMKGCGYESNISPRRLFDHWLAARDFLRQAAALPKPDVIVASLPDHVTASAAVAFGRANGIATIVDVRDKWPDIFVDYAPNRVHAAARRLALTIESRRSARALRDADAIISMMNSLMDWALRKAGRSRRPHDRVFYLTTTPKNFDVPREAVDPMTPVGNAIMATHGKIVFTYIGTFNRTEHPRLLLDALDLMAKRGTLDSARMAFVIGGDGIDADEVRRRAADYPSLHMLGWLETGPMSEMLAASDVGLVLMNFAAGAFQNKVFSYLASGLPIVSGATGDLADLIEQECIGLSIGAGDPAKLADAIERLTQDAPLRVDMAARSRALFDARFDRDANYTAYADHVETVAAAVAAGTRR